MRFAAWKFLKPFLVVAFLISLFTAGSAQSLQGGGQSVQKDPEKAAPPAENSFIDDWLADVTKIQSEQPHWVTPLVTVTPRLEQEYRYDQFWQSSAHGHTLNNYDGGKGVEFIPGQNFEVILGIPPYESRNTAENTAGFGDENLLLKYRITSENEENGNYILTAFLGVSIPSGSDALSSHHEVTTPTIAAGKGWGDFDVQSTLGVSIPDDGTALDGPGNQILFNTTLQYRVFKVFWPEVEFNYTYFANGEDEHRSQLYITPGIVLGRFDIHKRLGFTIGAGVQVAVTNNPDFNRNVVLSVRFPF